MLKYTTVAMALKTFSFGAPMGRLYRAVGNHFGGRKRGCLGFNTSLKTLKARAGLLTSHSTLSKDIQPCVT